MFFTDATAAICEAMQRVFMRFVTFKASGRR